MSEAMKFLVPNGPVLNVDDAGGTGLPVIFQHGLCGDARQTSEVFPKSGCFRRITIEARGHGASEAGGVTRFSIATFADDVAAYIEARKLGPVMLGGISMGACVALRLAVYRPELVRGLVLTRPAWVIDAAPGNMQPNAEVGALLARKSHVAARAAFMAGETAKRLAREAPDNLASLQGFFLREPQTVTAALLQSISADGPGVSEAQVRALKVPTLVIGHGFDSVHPLAYAEALAGMIDGARLTKITSKTEDRVRYVSEFQAALAEFLQSFCEVASRSNLTI